jgi:hypothetical protein
MEIPMKRLLVRLAGGYAGLGAIAYLVHRARYLATSRVRDWTDHRAQDLSRQLAELQDELRDARQQLRDRKMGRVSAPAENRQESKNRLFKKESPVGPAAERLAA